MPYGLVSCLGCLYFRLDGRIPEIESTIFGCDLLKEFGKYGKEWNKGIERIFSLGNRLLFKSVYLKHNPIYLKVKSCIRTPGLMASFVNPVQNKNVRLCSNYEEFQDGDGRALNLGRGETPLTPPWYQPCCPFSFCSFRNVPSYHPPALPQTCGCSGSQSHIHKGKNEKHIHTFFSYLNFLNCAQNHSPEPVKAEWEHSKITFLSFGHPFTVYLLSTCSFPSTALGPRDSIASKANMSPSSRASV